MPAPRSSISLAFWLSAAILVPTFAQGATPSTTRISGARTLLPEGAAGEFTSDWPIGLEPDMVFDAGEVRSLSVVALGQALFFDKGLSRDGSVSCATCHDPDHGFASPEPLAIGIEGRRGARNSPTIVNRAFGLSQFWDGRAATLAEQALGPLLGESEMGMTRSAIEAYVGGSTDYVEGFEAAFGSLPTLELVTEAIASFEMTVVSGSSPFDRFEWEGDQGALSESAQRGLLLFRGKARCSICHVGVNLSDEQFHNLGVGDPTGDPGRSEWTEDPADHGRFKTPSLRNVALTHPYMHDGSLATLGDVIDFYDAGGGENANLDPELRPLELTDLERGDLIAFLESLTGPIVYLHPEAFVQ